jgi:hypothetical protein
MKPSLMLDCSIYALSVGSVKLKAEFGLAKSDIVPKKRGYY